MSKYSAFRIPKSAFQNWVSFRLFHSAIRIPQSAIGNRGFTLIEIIILIVMAGILIPAIIVPFAAAVKGSGKPEKVTTAMYFAHQKMEELMKYDYGAGTTWTTAYADIDAINFPNYQWQWEIVYVPRDNLNATGQLNQYPAGINRGYKRMMVRVRDPELTTYEVYSVVTDFP
jgi:type II secretory pathway pseudopilin PulG